MKTIWLTLEVLLTLKHTWPKPRQNLLNLKKVFPFLFFNMCIYFNWRQITLQYCIGFSHTYINMNLPRTHVPRP